MRRATRQAWALVAAAVAVMLAGCATPAGNRSGYEEETPVNEIVGEWQLTKGSDADGAWSINGAPVTLVIGDEAVSGQAPCNIFGGDLSVDGTGIRIHDITQTLMACDDDARNRLETRYIAALGKVTTAKRGAGVLDTLTLSGPDETLTFTIVEKKTTNQP